MQALVVLSLLSLLHSQPEAVYQAQAAVVLEARQEVVLEDRTRCDLVTDTHALEVDFSLKWAEAVGQALHYARMTGKRAGVVLIVEKPGDAKYVERVRELVKAYALPLDVWTYDAVTEKLDPAP